MHDMAGHFKYARPDGFKYHVFDPSAVKFAAGPTFVLPTPPDWKPPKDPFSDEYGEEEGEENGDDGASEGGMEVGEAERPADVTSEPEVDTADANEGTLISFLRIGSTTKAQQGKRESLQRGKMVPIWRKTRP